MTGSIMRLIIFRMAAVMVLAIGLYPTSGLGSSGTPTDMKSTYRYACKEDNVEVMISRDHDGFHFDGARLNGKPYKFPRQDVLNAFFQNTEIIEYVLGQCSGDYQTLLPPSSPHLPDWVAVQISVDSKIKRLDGQVLDLMFYKNHENIEDSDILFTHCSVPSKNNVPNKAQFFHPIRCPFLPE